MSWNRKSTGILLSVVLYLFAGCIAKSQSLGDNYSRKIEGLAIKITRSVEKSGSQSGTVLDFTDIQGQGTALGRLIAQELSDHIVSAASGFSLVDRVNLQYLLRENKLSMDGFIDPASRRKLGNMMGIDTVIFGSVTPIGDNVRVSVRAVAIETGKIVSAQSSILPVPREILDLYNRGIPGAAGQNAGNQGARFAAKGFRSDSIKLTGRFIQYDDGIYGGFAGENTADAIASLVLENLTGGGFDASIKGGTQYVGACAGTNLKTATGIDYYRNNFKGNKTYVPANARIPIIIKVMYCKPQRRGVADVGFSLTIDIDGNLTTIPVSALNVPIQ